MSKRTLIVLAVLALVHIYAAALATHVGGQTVSDAVRMHLQHRLTTAETMRLTVAEYARLRQALVQYRRLAANGGWPALAAGPSLHQGDQDERVAALRHRLRATGDLVAPPAPHEPCLMRLWHRHDLLSPLCLREKSVPTPSRR